MPTDDHTDNLLVLGIPNCDKIRKTKTWLEEHDRPFQFIDLKKAPLSREELLELSQKVGLDALINRRGTTWRKLELADKNLSEAEMLDVLLENQSMILRPVLVRGDSVMIGYDEEAFEGFTASDRPMGNE
ncbi:MAG: hypothetical protein DBW78_01380 [Rhodothermaeota bacterium MED-G64]|nr:MAG: hypothetical protein DBW78_01380 [Rhodothermaeota bacterium MED-G64]RPF80100.1 MAG: Spx/MgsR family RNA polymerase-binding regulatory protein [Rhodothermaceae bacterium TMED105]HBD42579.1 hypothetical protein [Bacteroidota bacterium]|tara:strand:- start:559 stop:948 length:390 start_codon:yes stop_codon:yes gene_type:complete